ncbi:MAG: hypothetical protein QOE77_4157 [Blastocatellia bacterium]|jgi:uncharacterized membrane protein|nr:hypothetical protein [Blastocatellia bacterium]
MRMLAVAVAALTVAGCSSMPTVEPALRPTSSAPGTVTGGAGSTTGSPGSASTGQPSAPPPVSPVDSRCPAQLDEGQHNAAYGTPVPPDGFTVAWVLRCTVTPQVGAVTPQANTVRYLLVERSDSDPSALLAALRVADEAPSKGVCPAMAMVVPYFALVQRDGSALVPHIPVTDCRLPRPPVLQALNALQFSVIARHRLP